MTIADELQHYNDGLIDAFDAVDAKGGTIPQNKNLDNLPTAIGSISGGGGGTPDPVVVYNQTRPADWLKMPEIGENEDNVLYLLLHIDANTVEDISFVYGVTAYGNSPYGEVVWEFGSVNSGGEFVPDSTLTYTSPTINAAKTVYSNVALSPSVFTSVTSSGKKQLLCKISTTGTIELTNIRRTQVPDSLTTFGMIVEAKGKIAQSSLGVGLGQWGVYYNESTLRYFSLQGRVSSVAYAFKYCSSLTSILQLDTSSATNFFEMFEGCYSLTAIPQLDTSSGTEFTSMFRYCYSLTAIPQLDTSSGARFSSMFEGCYSLTAIPQLDTSSGTNFSCMFDSCYSLTAIPQLDTSSGAVFSYMFRNCYSLTSIPQLNTSSGTNFAYMFQNCYSLTDLDFTWLDLSTATGTSAISSIWNAVLFGGKPSLEIGDKWPAAGIVNTSSIVSLSAGNYATADYPVRVKINKTDAMLPIAVNATVLFSNIQYIYIYVPDDLLATYQADTKWATLGARLKGFSDLPS